MWNDPGGKLEAKNIERNFIRSHNHHYEKLVIGNYLTGTHRTTIRLRSSIRWHWRDVVGLAHLRCDHLGWERFSVSLLVLVASSWGVRSAFWYPPPPGTSAPPPLGILSPAQCYTPWKQKLCLRSPSCSQLSPATFYLSLNWSAPLNLLWSALLFCNLQEFIFKVFLLQLLCAF